MPVTWMISPADIVMPDKEYLRYLSSPSQSDPPLPPS
jgi:hypothetical protein